jgi:hypothetical protein
LIPRSKFQIFEEHREKRINIAIDPILSYLHVPQNFVSKNISNCTFYTYFRMYGYICIAIFMLLQVVAEASHHHNQTEPVHIDEKIKDAISLVLQNEDSHSNQPTTNDGVKTIPVKSITEESDSHPSNHEAKQKDIGDDNKKKVLGIWDEVPESGNFKVSDAVENLFLDQVNVRIEEFEDLKTQIAVLEQHLRKHSDFAEFNDTEHMLVDLDEKAINPYEEELTVMKKKIINSNHEMNASSVEMINTMVDDAEKFLEINRERVNGVLDDHVASEEHMHEHDDGSHSPENFADYVDLINDNETMVIIEEAETELLIEYIDMDIEEFKEIEKQKLEYEKQIKEQFNLDNIEPDELQLRIAQGVLKDMNLKDMKSHEELLLSLRAQIVEADGKLNIEEIDQMAATLGEAETYLDNSNNKLKLVGALEQEFQDFEKVESNIKPPKTTAGGADNKGAEEAANKVAGDSQQSLQEEVAGQPNNLEQVEAEIEV